jgi:hypothetical protein
MFYRTGFKRGENPLERNQVSFLLSRPDILVGQKKYELQREISFGSNFLLAEEQYHLSGSPVLMCLYDPLRTTVGEVVA